MMIKPAEFLGDSIEALRTFPDNARHDAGFQLDKIQRGEEPAIGSLQKKTQETSEKAIKLAKKRFKDLMKEQS